MKKYIILFLYLNIFIFKCFSQTIIISGSYNDNAINKHYTYEYNNYFCHLDAQNIDIIGEYASAPYPICVYITNTEEFTPFDNPENILVLQYLEFVKYVDDLHNQAKYKFNNLNFYTNDLDNIYLNILCFSGNKLYLFDYKIDMCSFPMYYLMNLKYSSTNTNNINVNISSNITNQNNIVNLSGIKIINNNVNKIYIQNNKKYIKK